MSLIENIFTEDQIDSSLCAAIRESLIEVYPGDKETFQSQRSFNGNRPLYTIVVQDGDTVCAHAAVVDGRIVVGEKELRVAGLGYLLVLPQYRGNNLGRRIATLAMEEAARRNFDLGLLFTVGTVQELYKPLGWSLLEERDFYYPENSEKQLLTQEILRMQYPLNCAGIPDGDVYLQTKYW